MVKTTTIHISLFLLLILGFPNKKVMAQQCLENLRKAQIIYDEGKLHEIPALLAVGCLKGNELNKEEKSQGYRLLILSYIYLDQPDQADQAMLNLLRISPTYKPVEVTDPYELTNLYKTFRTIPIFRWGVKVGINYSMVNIMKTHSVANSTNANGSYSGNINFTFYGFIERDFFQKRFILRAEPSFSLYKTTYTADNFPDHLGENTIKWKDIENQSWLGLNLLARYPILKKSKIKPVLILGPSAQYLLSATGSNQTSIAGGESASGADLEFITDGVRKRINLSAVAGIGIVLPTNKTSIVIDLYYQYGLVNITDKNTASEMSFKYGRAMSDLSLNNINITFGFLQDRYNPKKLTNYTRKK